MVQPLRMPSLAHKSVIIVCFLISSKKRFAHVLPFRTPPPTPKWTLLTHNSLLWWLMRLVWSYGWISDKKASIKSLTKVKALQRCMHDTRGEMSSGAFWNMGEPGRMLLRGVAKKLINSKWQVRGWLVPSRLTWKGTLENILPRLNLPILAHRPLIVPLILSRNWPVGREIQYLWEIKFFNLTFIIQFF